MGSGMDQVLDNLCKEYFEGNGKKIYGIVDQILMKKFGNIFLDRTEFYSLANEVFVNVVETWDRKRPFYPFLKTCLTNKILTLQTSMNKPGRKQSVEVEEREADGSVIVIRKFLDDISLSTVIGDEDDETYLEDIIGQEQRSDYLSDDMLEYIGNLTELQRDILYRLADGDKGVDIQRELGISAKIYNSQLADIRSYKNTKILLPSTGRRPKKESMEEKIMQTTEVIKFGNMSLGRYSEEIRDFKFRLDYKLQREECQWSQDYCGNLIGTIINGFRIGTVSIAEQVSSKGIVIKWVIDGKQRLSTCDFFIHDGFRVSKATERPLIQYQSTKRDDKGNVILGEDGSPICEILEFDIRGHKFSEFPKELQKKFLDYEVPYDMYLGCTDEDIEYHIRRLNNAKPMTHSQKGITHLGATLAAKAIEIEKSNFMKERYSRTDKKKGNVLNLVMSSVMLINFEDEWKGSPEVIGDFLNSNATTEMFNNLLDYVNRIDVVVKGDAVDRFTMKDSHIFFKVFDEFTKLGLPDEKFGEFMDAFDQELCNKCVDGVNWGELSELRNTRDLKTIKRKVDYLTALLSEFVAR